MRTGRGLFGLVGLLLLVTLVVAACGGATATPEPAIGKDDSGAMADVESSMGEAEAPKDQMEDEDSGAAEDMKAPTAEMEKETSKRAMDTEDSEDSMKEESQGKSEAEDSEAAMKEEPAAEMEEATADEEMASAEETNIDFPAWFSAELVDVRAGDAFTVADLQNKVVLVETMAIWCSNCLRQQQEVKALHEALGEQEGLVTVVLDIDPNENAENLKDYAAKHGFDWIYAVAPREVAREIGQLYGDQYLNPPATPMLIIDQHGEVHLLPFGRKTAEELQQELEPFLTGEM